MLEADGSVDPCLGSSPAYRETTGSSVCHLTVLCSEEGVSFLAAILIEEKPELLKDMVILSDVNTMALKLSR